MKNLYYQPSVRYRVFNRLFEESEPSPFREGNESYDAIFHLPGLKKEAVALSVLNDELKITAKSPEDALVTIDYDKTFSLPEDANVEEVQAKLEDGILSVSIPKVTQVDNPERVIEIS